MAAATMQSALAGAPGSAAEAIGRLGDLLYVGAGAIFLFVMALAIYSVFAKPRAVNVRRWIVGGGLVFPIVVLTALLVYSLRTGDALSHSAAASGSSESEPLRIRVVGKQWWWEVRYVGHAQGTEIVLANEVRLPVGRPVELLLTSTDVIHSFWVPALAGKVDMIPGRTTRVALRADETGIFRGQCAEYCGGQHALMALYVVAQSQSDFESWLARQARPAQRPDDSFLKLGYDAFFKGNCQACHAIRGTPAAGTLGPDLTHVGGRHSLAAGVLDNHIGTMAGWIAGTQDVKPGSKMPSTRTFTGIELRAISAWLGSLQ